MTSKKINIRNVELPKDKYSVKAPYSMKPVGATLHETDNKASAADEISYMHRNNNEVSFHFAVDENEIIQGLPLDRNGWHAGDGAKGPGNRTTIAIEICRNYRVDNLDAYYKARKNAEALVGWLLHEYGWDESNIHTHNEWSGKNCPRVILSEAYLSKFKANAIKERDSYKEAPVKPEPVAPKPNTSGLSKGDSVVVNGYVHANADGAGRGIKLSNHKDTIKYTAEGKPYPYHIGGLGWMSANDVKPLGSAPALKPKPKPAQKPKPNTSSIGRGDLVIVNGYVHATAAGTGRGIKLSNHKANITHMSIGAAYPYHVDNIGWVSASAIGASSSSSKELGKLSSVIVNGRVHATAAGAGPGRTLTNHRGVITFVSKGSKFPYHIDSLGWVSASAVK